MTFSENVTGFNATHIVAGNATISNFAGGGTTYTFNLLPVADGLVTADIPAEVATDAAGNSNTAAAQFSRTYVSATPICTQIVI